MSLERPRLYSTLRTMGHLPRQVSYTLRFSVVELLAICEAKGCGTINASLVHDWIEEGVRARTAELMREAPHPEQLGLDFGSGESHVRAVAQ